MIFHQLIISSLLLWSCDTGKLQVVASIPNSLKEISAAEILPDSDLLWVIEDAGNDNHVYGLDKKGAIKKDIVIQNSENEDWEDLTSDGDGNLYIGDFGNNSGKRDKFTIYKINHPEKSSKESRAERIDFTLPEKMKSKDFEAFFVYKDFFYLFSKESKKNVLLKIPNVVGSHTAELVTEFNFKGKDNLITSADISEDGKTIILLNHDKVWKLDDYDSDNFFQGSIQELPFNYSSQMEGVCFKSNSKVYITDESNGNLGSNLYDFVIN